MVGPARDIDDSTRLIDLVVGDNLSGVAAAANTPTHVHSPRASRAPGRRQRKLAVADDQPRCEALVAEAAFALL